MGLRDFARNAGAAVGIGKSTKEIAQDKEKKAKAEAAMTAAEEADKAAAAAEKAAREATAKAKAEKDATAKAAAEKAAKDAAAKAAADRAAAQKAAEAAAEAAGERQRSTELESYIAKLGLSVQDLDIRFDDGVAYIAGTASNTAEREKVVLAVGNTDGVSRVVDWIKVPAPSVDTEPEPEPRFHTVASGDTLSKIAKAMYGDAGKYPAIFEANKPMLSDPNKIFVGQVLRIPEL